ncbi:MAG: hypothetical protein M1817_006071 [Caeruleum heppii]|nr:MAG: hypothetical protein M1817_006071 [Caeruleum heppii]
MQSPTSPQGRQPPPSLFLGPPSRDTSHVSLPSSVLHNAPSTTAPASASASNRVAALAGRTTRQGPSRTDNASEADSQASPFSASRPSQQQHDAGRKQADRTEALWAEMQSTLEEVELSAVNGTHVFGAQHSKALEDLRSAQIALAQAWARSEADEALEAGGDLTNVKGTGLLAADGVSKPGAAGDTLDNSGPSLPGTNPRRPGQERRGSKLEEETESDILLARKRREANDRYFQRVNGGVLDVVAKLEDVAVAMRGVEQESRDVWTDSSDSVGTSTT